MTTRFTRLEALVPFAQRRALRGVYDGWVTPTAERYIDLCRHVWSFTLGTSAIVLFTRDVDHHTSGWWKNPDYERCWHLSLSYRELDGRPIDPDRSRSEELARAFFADDIAHCWVEGPYSPEGKVAQVWHCRVFADEGWEPIKPRGEVYNTDWTPADWKSFSEVHGYTPAREQAPFLLAAQ